MIEKLITAKSLSEITGIPVFTIQKMCREYTIPCYRVTRHYMFKESEISEWLESKRQNVINSNDIKINLIRNVNVN